MCQRSNVREGGAKHDYKVFLLSNSKIWKFIYWDGLKEVRSPDSDVVIVRCLLEVQVPESNKQLEMWILELKTQV